MELVKAARDLNTKQKKFAKEFLDGEHQGNGTRCYQLAYDVVGKTLSDDSAGSCAAVLLKDPRITQYLRTLSEKAAAKLQHTMQPFEDLAPEAQAVLVQCLRGECRSRMKYDSAPHILDRALGRPVQKAETEFSLNPDGVLTALHALAGRKRLELEASDGTK